MNFKNAVMCGGSTDIRVVQDKVERPIAVFRQLEYVIECHCA